MNKEIRRKKEALEFNNLMKALIVNDITVEQYNSIINKLTLQLADDPSGLIAPNSFEFVNYIKNIHSGEYNTVEMFYPIIISVMLFYIENIKELDSFNSTSTPLTEIVVNFAELTGIGIEMVGDICAYDIYFKKFLEYENKECITMEQPQRIYKEYQVEVATDLFNW